MKRHIRQAATTMHHAHCRDRHRTGSGPDRGFTLIELMIVVAVIAILAAVAYPSYVRYITKTHRVAAEGCLSEYSNWMERFYTTNLRYDKDTGGTAVAPPFTTMDCAATSQTGNDYTYAFAAGQPTRTTYTITATPINAQASRDTTCAALSIDQSGTRTVSGSGTVAQCW